MRSRMLLLWGVAIYSVTYLAWSGLSLYAITKPLSSIVIFATLIIICLVAGRSLHFSYWKDVLPYSALWLFTVALLDGLYVVPFTGIDLYADPNLWFGYALVLIVPLVAPSLEKTNAPHIQIT